MVSRREFVKNALALISFALRPERARGQTKGSAAEATAPPGGAFRFARMSVERFRDLQNDIDGLRRTGRLSRNPVYRSYIDSKKFVVPKDFPQAKSVLILAYRTPMARVGFFLDGRRHEIIIPPQYYDDGVTPEVVKAFVRNDILGDPAARLEDARGMHLKLLAVRSGLGRYGRNNICFVEGLGTFLTLQAFFTAVPFPAEEWHPLGMVDACRDCSICYGICPTNAITRENFVIDAGRCLTLYNEVEGDFPNWILPSMHNALVGCLKCQLPCPDNAPYLAASTIVLEDVAEEETRRILEGRLDDQLLETLSRKLRKFAFAGSRKGAPLLARNLRPLVRPGRS
jgi:epoxyqueuosine reductase